MAAPRIKKKKKKEKRKRQEKEKKSKKNRSEERRGRQNEHGEGTKKKRKKGGGAKEDRRLMSAQSHDRDGQHTVQRPRYHSTPATTSLLLASVPPFCTGRTAVPVVASVSTTVLYGTEKSTIRGSSTAGCTRRSERRSLFLAAPALLRLRTLHTCVCSKTWFKMIKKRVDKMADREGGLCTNWRNERGRWGRPRGSGEQRR